MPWCLKPQYVQHRKRTLTTFYPAMLLLLMLFAPLTQADPLVDLGRALFTDPNLSEPPGQACATCHNPERAFSDGRPGPLSLGADGHSTGQRNTPGLTYVGSVPAFSLLEGHYQGGLFLDGRAATLSEQAIEPMLNPLEMAMPSESAIAARVLENPNHRSALTAIFGASAESDPAATIRAITTAIAAFERSAEFSSFDSKYDRYLNGDYEMTQAEAIGREVFFSGLVNCIQCHLNNPERVSPKETFTNHRYHNIGTPLNPEIASQADLGLGGRLEAAEEAGKFRVPTLRNVAVTAPYMHNGVFAELETAVAFYAKYMLRNQRNPETGEHWAAPAVPDTVDLEVLSDGQPVDPARVQHLTAFLKTLTDRRYEHLLD